MPLSKDEYRRRLAAAAALNDTTLDGIDALLEEPEWGLGKEAASRAGREGDKHRAPTRTLSKALGQELNVGENWFEEPDWWKLIRGATEPDADEADLGEIEEGAAELDSPPPEQSEEEDDEGGSSAADG